MEKKKPFLQLSIIFFVIICFAIFDSWGSRGSMAQSESMMNLSMASMMSMMHLQSFDPNYVLSQSEQQHATDEGASEHASYHSGTGGMLKTIHYLTTATIVVLLPLIVAGTAFLFIMWSGNQKS